MTTRPPAASPWLRLRAWLTGGTAPPRTAPACNSAEAAHSDSQRAQALIAAIDAGGLPLNPARVNDIARRLGLEVSRSAPMEQTIARIRALLAQPGTAPAVLPAAPAAAEPAPRPNPLRRR